MTAAGRLDVGIIGAGRVGAVLGAALGGAGHRIVGYSAIADANIERAEVLLPSVPRLDPPEIVERADLVLVAVPDGELAGFVSGLAEIGAWRPGQIVAHTAPGFGVDVLRPAVAAGAIPIALGPALAFTGTSVDLARLKESWCAVTAPSPVLPIGQALVVEIGAEPVVVAEESRAEWAAALEAAAAWPATIIGDAIRRLGAVGVERPAAVLGPLARSALERALAAPRPHTLDTPAGDGPVREE